MIKYLNYISIKGLPQISSNNMVKKIFLQHTVKEDFKIVGQYEFKSAHPLPFYTVPKSICVCAHVQTLVYVMVKNQESHRKH